MATFQDKLRIIKTLLKEKKYQEMQEKIIELLPEAKSKNPEEWFIQKTNYSFVRKEEFTSAGYTLIEGELTIGDITKKGNTRICVYVKDATENMTCWFYYSTGVSNPGRNFKNFLLPLDDFYILAGMLGVGGSFPKKRDRPVNPSRSAP